MHPFGGIVGSMVGQYEAKAKQDAEPAAAATS